MKIYSFDGKKKNIDNFDIYSSPLFLGQKFDCGGEEEDINANDEQDTNGKTQN